MQLELLELPIANRRSGAAHTFAIGATSFTGHRLQPELDLLRKPVPPLPEDKVRPLVVGRGFGHLHVCGHLQLLTGHRHWVLSPAVSPTQIGGLMDYQDVDVDQASVLCYLYNQDERPVLHLVHVYGNIAIIRLIMVKSRSGTTIMYSFLPSCLRPGEAQAFVVVQAWDFDHDVVLQSDLVHELAVNLVPRQGQGAVTRTVIMTTNTATFEILIANPVKRKILSIMTISEIQNLK
ncbi:hypothetical protein LTR37_008944 [Vermiconidia calcicola]|uniref:Uncharacterized protein n=1 Tax=Vermiconidia calcicola TaxID=1690605 RepID=A0ACC3NAB6_9PEZI|nr:hypothetical protein LTR37_008944 [Vermiconidia calcicola]